MRKPDEIEADIIVLKEELAKSRKHYKLPPPIIIPHWMKLKYPEYLKNREYYTDAMEQLVWEEED